MLPITDIADVLPRDLGEYDVPLKDSIPSGHVFIFPLHFLYGEIYAWDLNTIDCEDLPINKLWNFLIRLFSLITYVQLIAQFGFESELTDCFDYCYYNLTKINVYNSGSQPGVHRMIFGGP